MIAFVVLVCVIVAVAQWCASYAISTLLVLTVYTVYHVYTNPLLLSTLNTILMMLGKSAPAALPQARRHRELLRITYQYEGKSYVLDVPFKPSQDDITIYTENDDALQQYPHLHNIPICVNANMLGCSSIRVIRNGDERTFTDNNYPEM